MERFLGIKKRMRLSVALTAAVIAAGVGTVAFSTVLFMVKSLVITADVRSYIACAAAALTAFIVTFFVTLPSDKRLAKGLDEKYSLDEKVRTMVEFADSDDMFAKLQREDADERLGRLRIGFFNKKQAVAIILAVAIAVISLTGAALMPRKEPVLPEEEPVSKFDKELIIAELSELVSTVDGSIMSDGLKSDIITELNELIKFVKAHDYMSEMKLEAVSAVLFIDGALDDANSAPKLGAVLAESSNTMLKELGEGLEEMSGSKTKKLLEELIEWVEYADLDDVRFVADEMGAALDRTEAENDNALVSQISGLLAALRGYINDIGGADGAFSGMPLAFSNEVMVQNVNKMTTQTVISRLCEIFGISPDDLNSAEGGEDIDIRPPSDIAPDEEGTEIEEPDNPIGDGGIGTGDRVYGSNDVIYDPHSNTYVTYGTLLDEYNAKATDKILDGRINEDFKKFIEEYFKSLSEYTSPET